MRRVRWHKMLIAVGLLSGVALVAGAANPGNSIENSDENSCGTAVWPLIPAHCFGDEQVRAVSFTATEMLERPELSTLEPDVASAKGDLLKLPKSVQRYRTVEIRGDGVSKLRRVPLE